MVCFAKVAYPTTVLSGLDERASLYGSIAHIAGPRAMWGPTDVCHLKKLCCEADQLRVGRQGSVRGEEFIIRSGAPEMVKELERDRVRHDRGLGPPTFSPCFLP